MFASFRARAALIALVATSIVMLPVVAFAQEEKRPVIDSAPEEVKYGANAMIAGHMESSDGSEQVTLQKKKQEDEWRDLATHAVDEDGSVRFELNDLRRSSTYRLLWEDATGQGHPSEAAHIRVAARVDLNVSRHHLMKGAQVTLSGTVQPARAGREVELQQRVDGAWRDLATRPVRDGRFRYTYEPQRKGYTPVRAVFAGDDDNAADKDRNSFKVYERDPATWYGPGFYGQRTACGERLQRDTLGVAHRSLPCGTKVSFLHKGRTITVQVIDRGPYGEADWDLTEETAERLRFQGSRAIGVTR